MCEHLHWLFLAPSLVYPIENSWNDELDLGWMGWQLSFLDQFLMMTWGVADLLPGALDLSLMGCSHPTTPLHYCWKLCCLRLLPWVASDLEPAACSCSSCLLGSL